MKLARSLGSGSLFSELDGLGPLAVRPANSPRANDSLHKIRSVAPQISGDVGFFWSAIVRLPLPRRRTDREEFSRVDGRYELSLRCRSGMPLPFGKYPRAILLALITLAVRTESDTLTLPTSVGAWIEEILGFPTAGGQGAKMQSEMRRQFLSLLNTEYAFRSIDNPARNTAVFIPFVDAYDISWLADKRRSGRPTYQERMLRTNTVILSRTFTDELLAFRRLVALDARVVRALNVDAFTFDLYLKTTFIHYQMQKSGRERQLLDYDKLIGYFYDDADCPASAKKLRQRRFKLRKKITAAFRLFNEFGYDVKADFCQEGMVLYKNRPHIKPRPSVRVAGRAALKKA